MTRRRVALRLAPRQRETRSRRTVALQPVIAELLADPRATGEAIIARLAAAWPGRAAVLAAALRRVVLPLAVVDVEATKRLLPALDHYERWARHAPRCLARTVAALPSPPRRWGDHVQLVRGGKRYQRA